MKTKILKLFGKGMGLLLLPACMAIAGCNAEPDDSNRYTFTGETAEDFLANRDSLYSSFNYILQRSRYDRLLSTYGKITCFAPTNEAIAVYIDSLYNDVEARIEHNGMTENSLEGLSDSLCTDIAEYHLVNNEKKMIKNMDNSTCRTILGREITTAIDSLNGISYAVIGGGSYVIDGDNEVENGVVHGVNKVIPRSNRLVNEAFMKAKDYTIFNAALELTGLSDSLSKQEKDIEFTTPPTDKEDPNGYYTPTECKYGFTVFAESDEVFKENGINSIDDLIAKAKEWYGQAATGSKPSSVNATQGWYDYYRNNNVTISTGDDYTSEKNVLNMFVRYHILNAALSARNLALDYNIVNGTGVDGAKYSGNAYGYTGDAIDYFETMLPKTLMKMWKVKSEGKIYINRYVENNTLTDKVESLGSSSMHSIEFEGVWVKTDQALDPPINGYIYPIDKILLYDARVPNGVLHERMRFDCLTLLPEIMNNGFRGMFIDELQGITGKSESRVRFPINYFDNIIVYNGNKTTLDMNCASKTNSYLAYKGDTFQGKGVYDFAIKMPPVPDGTYELRVALTNFGADRGSMMQYYLGESSDVNSMQAIDIPMDLRMSSTKPMEDSRVVEIGYVPINDETNYPDAYEDRGVETDKVMRQHGYMREGLSIVKSTDASMIGRFVAYQFRRILIKRDFKQRDMWLRVKTALPDEDTRKFQIDYIELCPVGIAESSQYMEDMY